VGGDKSRRRGKSGNRPWINLMPRHHGVCNARDRRHLGRNRSSRLSEALETLPQTENAAIRAVEEARHGEFDDFVVTRIQARCFHINKQPQAQANGLGGRQRRSRLQLA